MKKKIIFFVILISLILCIHFYVNKDEEIKEIKEEKLVEKTITKPSSIQAYTYNGEKTDKTYEWLLLNKTVNKITCKNGTVGTFNYDDYSVSLSNIHMPDYCTLDFKEGYSVSLTAGSTGTVSPASQTIGYNGKVSFSVAPGDEYKLALSSNSCGGTLSGNTYTVSNVTSNMDCTIKFKPLINEFEWESGTLGYKLLEDNPTRSTRTDFSTTFTTVNTGTLYTATEDNSQTEKTKVYYYAGNAQNNWVKFGGFYWRIIRTNSDGSVRMLYSGTSPDTTSGYISKSAFNSTYNNPMYVGYMYGTSGSLNSNRQNTNDSTIKGVIDTWYKNNLTSYTSYLSTTAVYCNDRKLASGSTYSTSSSFNYAARGRLYTNKTPTYDCTNSKDAFSGSNSEAKLTYPIALMTADEIAYAGGVILKSLSSPYAWYYLNSSGSSITGSTYWWLLSPYYWSDSYAVSFIVYGSSTPGYLTSNVVDNSYGVRPVISINSTVKASGSGTSNDPYILSV